MIFGGRRIVPRAQYKQACHFAVMTAKRPLVRGGKKSPLRPYQLCRCILHKNRGCAIITKRKRQLTVRFTEEEYAALKGKCEIAGMKMEPFVRALVEGCKIKPAPPDSYNKLRQQLSAIGNNLNQLTHIANSTGRVSDSQLDRAQSLLEDMWRCVRDSL